MAFTCTSSLYIHAACGGFWIRYRYCFGRPRQTMNAAQCGAYGTCLSSAQQQPEQQLVVCGGTGAPSQAAQSQQSISSGLMPAWADNVDCSAAQCMTVGQCLIPTTPEHRIKGGHGAGAPIQAACYLNRAYHLGPPTSAFSVIVGCSASECILLRSCLGPLQKSASA